MVREPGSASEPILPQDSPVGRETDGQPNANGNADHSAPQTPLLGNIIVEAVADPDPQGFQWGLVQAIAEQARAAAPGGRGCLAVMLCQLGLALQYELDDDLAFDDFVQDLARRRPSIDLLRLAVPAVAGFLARVVARPLLQAKPDATQADLAALLLVANEVVRDSFERIGIRAWQSLPQIAETIASRGAQRGVSIGALTEALPRLRERLCPRNHEPQRRPGAASAPVNLGEM